MSKYIKEFENEQDMVTYLETAPGGKFYLFKNKSGLDGIGSLGDGKKIVSHYKNQRNYLTFEMLENGTWTPQVNKLSNPSAEGLTFTSLSYRKNGGDWISFDLSGSNPSIQLVTGDKVELKGITTNTSTNFSGPSTLFWNIFGKRVKVYGSVMSLHNETPDDLICDKNKEFNSLFRGCTLFNFDGIELPATTLSPYCYQYMFTGCTNLTMAPELPATTLTDWCYAYMFQDCTSLTMAPELPATTLALQCYNSMFQNCTSLTMAPEILKPLNIANCYGNMFRNCSSLNYIKIYTDSWNNYLYGDWVNGVPSTGTFYKKTGVNIPTGNNGIPSGWTVVEFD